MANEEAVGDRSFWSELFATEVYKASQGKLVRQITCLAIWMIALLGSWRLYEGFFKEFQFRQWGLTGTSGDVLRYGFPFLALAAGLWFGYRMVNWPRFADFLISVEAELNKVTWPSRSELVRASMVVMFTIFFLALLLFFYDMLWQAIFSSLGIS